MTASFSRSQFVAVIVACGFFLITLDGSIVTIALPQIALSFGVRPVQLSIIVTAYLLTAAVFIPISAWIADRFGANTIFKTSIAIFTLGSVWCAFSSGITEMTIARALQGIGGAMVVPVGRAVVLRAATKSEFVSAMIYLSLPAQIGSVAGPLLGGYITTFASWRWIFLINVPIGIVGIVLATLFIENHRETERTPLDWLGFLLTGLALSALTYGFQLLASNDFRPIEVVSCLAGGSVAGWFAVRHARRHPHPMIDLSLLRIPTFRVHFLGGTLVRIGWGGLPFLLPLLFELIFGMSAFSAGELTFLVALGSFFMRANAGRVMRRFGFRAVLVWNTVAGAVIIVLYIPLAPTTPLPLIIAILLTTGFSQAIEVVAMNALAYSDIEPRQMSVATGLAQVVNQLGAAMGVVVASVVLHLAASASGRAQPAAVDFMLAFGVCSAVLLAGAPFYHNLAADSGAEVSGHRGRGAASPTPSDPVKINAAPRESGIEPD